MKLIDRTIIAKNIYNSRISSKISRHDLAIKINVSSKSVYNWEKEKVFPNLIHILSLCNCFNRKVDEFLGIKKASVL